MKLKQKHPLKGSREFELVNDEVHVSIDMPFLKKDFTVVLSILDPDPVTRGSKLAFLSAVNREPLLEFFHDNPDPHAFNEFVKAVQLRATEEDFGKPKQSGSNRTINVSEVHNAAEMLRTYLNADEIEPFLASLESLKNEPDNPACFSAMVAAFNALGPLQGAVLTHAPYITALFSDDPPD